ncbi:MAG TPA: DUF6785 family protein [Capsulimonadaceae bacterium]|jgi:hypothetical protein
MSTLAQPPSSTGGEPATPAPPRQYALRGRALAIGIPLVAIISVISVYADMVTKTVQFGVLQLAPPAVVGLFLLVLLNKGLSRLAKRELLHAGDILIIYTMLLVAVMVSTRGVIEKMIPPLAYLPYHSTDTTRYNELLTRHLPSWILPFSPTPSSACPDGLRAYYEGLGHGQPVPFEAWVGPLFAMLGLVACVVLVFICLSVLIRRQWADNERLSFPLTALPVAMIRDDIDGHPFMRNKMLWAGFFFTCAIFMINGIHANVPALPNIPLNFPVSAQFTVRPWSQIDYTVIYISFAAIGFAYLLPNDLLFSLWFFFILTRLEDVIMVQMGGIPTGIGTHNARVFTGHQAAGAYIVLVISYIVLGKEHFTNVLKTAFTKNKTIDDSTEMMSYRTAIFGMLAGFAGVITWLSLAGMSPWLAASIMGIYMFFIAVIMSRAVNEAGLLMTETSFLPTHLIQFVAPVSSWGPANITLTALTNNMFCRDLRGVLLSPLMDAQKMAGDIRLKQRSLLAPFVIAGLVAFFVAAAAFLYVSYTKGHITLYSYPDNNSGNLYKGAATAIKGLGVPFDKTAPGGLALGIAVTAAMVRLRTMLPWFPLHPLAYAVAPTWSMIVLWFPCFLAWVIKVPVMRYGGIAMYRQLRPFMLGMILGEFTMAMLWAVLSTPAIGLSAPDFPWP